MTSVIRPGLSLPLTESRILNSCVRATRFGRVPSWILRGSAEIAPKTTSRTVFGCVFSDVVSCGESWETSGGHDDVSEWRLTYLNTESQVVIAELYRR